MGKSEETQRRMRQGVRAWLGSTRKVAPGTIAAFLAASAVAPVAAPALSGGAELQPLIDLLGNMGANYLSGALVDAGERIRREDGSVEEGELRDALAAELLARLDASEEAAADVRAEVAGLVQALGGIEELLGDVLVSSERTRQDVAAGLQELSGELTALRVTRRREEQAQRQVTTELNRLVREILRERPRPEPPAAEPAGEEAAPAPGERPYLGLRSFEFDDAHLFFGRRELTGTLLDQLALRLDGSGPLMVLGPSGSGKSSLLRAALLPGLDAGGLGVPGSEDWPRILLTPGPAPLDALAAHVAHVSDVPAGDIRAHPERLALAIHQAVLASVPGPEPSEERERPRMIVVVDQFEELFTLCRDPGERAAYVTALADAARQRALVVIGMRADFFPQCAALPSLVEPLGSAIVVGPMSEPQLREAIEGPAVHGGWRLEPGLAETVLADLRDPAGTLPLLSHVLAATWTRRRGHTLTIAGYREAGGLHGSIAAAAEEVYAGLDDDVKAIARRTLLALVAVGEGTQDARRRRSRAELVERFERNQAPAANAVIDAFLAKRLLVADRDTIEISHEALLRAWPRFQRWLSDDREWLRAHAQLTEAAAAWQALGREPGSLYRGARLAAAREWRDNPDLAPLERAFLDASIAAHRTELATERARSRRLRVLAAGLAIAAVVAAVGAVVATRQRSVAVRERAESDAERVLTRSRQLAARSDLLRPSWAASSVVHALAAWRTAHTPEARSSLIHAANVPVPAAAGQARSAVDSAGVSPHGRWIAEVTQIGNRRYLTQTHPVDAPARGGGMQEYQPIVTVVARDGRHTAITDLNGGVTVFAGDEKVTRFVPGPELPVATFTPDGTRIVYSARNGSVVVQDVSTLRAMPELQSVLEPPPGTVLRGGPVDARLTSVAAAPDGRSVVAGTDDGRVLAWSLRRPARPQVVRAHTGAWVGALAYRADGRLLVSGANDNTLRLWTVVDGRLEDRGVTMTMSLESPSQVAFGRRGEILMVRAGDGVEAWDMESHRSLGTFVDASLPETAFLSADGKTLETVGDDGGRRRWSLRPATLPGHRGEIYGIAFTGRDGLVTASREEGVRVWSTGRRAQTARLTGAAGILELAVSPDGSAVATDDDQARVSVWDPDVGGRPQVLHSDDDTGGNDGLGFPDPDTMIALNRAGPSLWFWRRGPAGRWGKRTRVQLGPGSFVLAVNPRRRLLAIAGVNAPIEVWDAPTRRRLWSARIRQQVDSLAFSDDGSRLAVVGSDGTVQLWDVDAKRPLGAPFTAQGANVNTAALTPDGRTLATGGPDRKVRLWHVDTRAVIATLEGHAAPLSRLAFDRRGTTLATGDHDGRVVLWNVDPDAIARTLCTKMRGDAAARRELARGVAALRPRLR